MENVTTKTTETLQRDEVIWQIAKERVEFKKHLLVYLLVNAFLWVLYLFTGSHNHGSYTAIPWPAWTSFFWGVGLVSHYIKAYHSKGTNQQIEEEYQKLINKN